MIKETILVIGAGGQIGTELTAALRQENGDYSVVAADLLASTPNLEARGPYEQLDVLNKRALSAVIDRHDITQVYLLAAMLSATGERHPDKAWQLNMQSLLYVLDLAREKGLSKVFWPSSIAVFGPDAPAQNCPQDARLTPSTVYGISKAAGENWCQYYYSKYGIDVRSLRYPGLISHAAQPGGGTTDYAVDIFRHALESGKYTCYLRLDTALPMLYMPDAIQATLQLMHASASQISCRTSYNLAGFTVTPFELGQAIRRHLPHFSLDAAPDERQSIAESWPMSINDQVARRDWGWHPRYTIEAMTEDMLTHLSKRMAFR